MTTESDGPHITLTDCPDHGDETLAADGECVLCINDRDDVDHPAIGVAIGIEQIDRGQTATLEDIEAALDSDPNDD